MNTMSPASIWPRLYAAAPGHLAGEGLDGSLARIADLGFDGLWLLGSGPVAPELPRAIAAAGLAPILDLAIARLPARADLVRRAPGLFRPVTPEDYAALDPRRPDTSLMRLADHADHRALADAVLALLGPLIEAGAAGCVVRGAACCQPRRSSPA
ncbi:MAG: hypothetical protein R3D25_19495 [Geminicoccaceae bacterium]